ncbi:MAG: 4-hydroxybenzoate octaprenyltransferase [Gammaproteobacteria bacterium]|nr:4-hydroxybenzoate octaprenyltransferase [Gammaproteobacteria bacterium]
MSNFRARFTDYCHLIRLHRPIPILLMLWPTLWGLWIASSGIPAWKYLVIFIAGVIVMRSAGDIFNDLADRKLDGFIERTQMRPLATGRISVKAALAFAFILCLIALGLVLMLNTLCLILAFVGLALAIAYPFMKRIIHFPQVVLGIAYNWGIVMAFAAVQNHTPWQAWYLLAIAVIWTVAYDTMYALADKKDDLKTGIKSTAVLFGNHYHAWIATLQAITWIGLLAFGLLQHFHWIFYLCLMLTLPFFIYQHTLLPEHQIKRCIQAFNNNQWIGLLITIGIAFSLFI